MENDNKHDLIESDRVIGADVYDLNGNHIGSIERLMLQKIGGIVSHAVLSFGGFFGIGDNHYPIPWQKLKYDEKLDGYRADISKTQIEGAPSYNANEDYDWSRDVNAELLKHYGEPPYWR